MALTEERYINPDIDITNAINTVRREAKEEGLAEGMERGLAEGIEKAHLETVRKMKEKGFDNK